MTRERVLVIDGSPETQQLLAELVLEPNDYRPLAALTGADGLRLAEEERPDLIILDMHLSDTDGLAVLQTLQDRSVGTPIVFSTVRESAEMVVQAFRLGARDYVIKPYAPREMLEAIQRALAGAQSGAEQGQIPQQFLAADQQLWRQLQELNAIYTIGQSVTSTLDLNRVLSRVVEAAVYVAGAEEGQLMLLDDAGKELYMRATKNIDEDVAQNLRVRVRDSVVGRAIQTKRPVLLAGEDTKLVTGYLVKALLYIPLRAPERGVIGALGVVNRQSDRPFSERDIFLLSAMADYAAIAIENARLFETAETERAKLEAVLRGTQEPIIVVDEEDTVLLCNAAARAAFYLDDTTDVHRPITEIVSNEAVIEIFARRREHGKVIHGEVPLEDGRTFNAQLTSIAGVGRVLVMQDITHLKELNRVKSEFVSALSHDLRTPLTSVQGYVELLPRVGPLTERQEEFIQRVRDSMKTITNLLNDLLDIDRIETGLDLEMEPCDMVQVIESAIDEFAPRAETKQQDLRWKRPKKLPQVIGSPHRLRQVVRNLISNAVKYTPEGGWVAITADEEDEHVVVRVADSGIGISPAEQPFIFDRFYRVETKETVGIVGTGLGLAIVKAVIERHNGRVWVESSPGGGSVFAFVLPALKE